MYVCMYVYIYIEHTYYTSTQYVCMYVYIYNIHSYIQYTHTYMYACIYIYICMYIDVRELQTLIFMR